MLCRNRTSDFHGPPNKPMIDFPCLYGFIIVTRQDVHMNVIVADVTEDRITQVAAAQILLIEAQHARECLVGHRHIGRNLALVVPREPFVHEYRQRMTKLAQLRLVLFVSGKPGLIRQSVMLFEECQPLVHQLIFAGRRGFLLEKDRADGLAWNCLVLLTQEVQRLDVEILQSTSVEIIRVALPYGRATDTIDRALLYGRATAPNSQRAFASVADKCQKIIFIVKENNSA